MLIAHLPSGYILSVLSLQRIRQMKIKPASVMCACMVGAVFPDLDLLYFYLIDHRQTHHHQYFPHWPVLWLGLICLSVLWLWLDKTAKPAALLQLFVTGGLLHMVLDSVAGDVWWFAPFSDQSYGIFTVPARFDPWWLSFILHWTFAFELVICLWAVMIFWRRNSLTTDKAA